MRTSATYTYTCTYIPLAPVALVSVEDRAQRVLEQLDRAPRVRPGLETAALLGRQAPRRESSEREREKHHARYRIVTG